MAAILVILTIVVAVGLDVALMAYRRRHGMAPAAVAPRAMLEPRPPQGVFLDAAHSWVRITTEGTLRVGVDEFLIDALGEVEAVRVPGRGTRVKRGDPLITVHFAPQAPLATADATLARVRRLADELDLPVAMRLHQAPWEIEQSLREFGQRPLARLAALGLVSPQLVAVHLTQCEPGDLELLAAAGASVVHCPTADLAAGAGLCPLARLLGRGVRVALGTDTGIAGGGLDVLAEARLAGLLSAGVAAVPGEVVASDLLRMATLEGARTLGLGDVTGSLVPGKWADLCCLDLRNSRSWPVHDVAVAVVYAACSLQVTDAWVAGRRVLADARLTQLDEAEVLERAERWRARFAADTPEGTDADA